MTDNESILKITYDCNGNEVINYRADRVCLAEALEDKELLARVMADLLISQGKTLIVSYERKTQEYLDHTIEEILG